MSVELENRVQPRCEVVTLGQVPYTEGLELQRRLLRQRARDEIPDQLLLLQHPHVITCGRSAREGNILASAMRLRQLGVEVHEADRGGDVTYHGPGQLVAYPIIDLKPDRCDLHRYVRDLERVLLATLRTYGVLAHTVRGRTGVWVRHKVGEAKIGAIGVRVSRWITSHGIALNVSPQLEYFRLIVPCGLQQSAVTSLRELRRRPAPTVEQVGREFARHFATVFGRQLSRREGRQP